MCPMTADSQFSSVCASLSLRCFSVPDQFAMLSNIDIYGLLFFFFLSYSSFVELEVEEEEVALQTQMNKFRNRDVAPFGGGRNQFAHTELVTAFGGCCCCSDVCKVLLLLLLLLVLTFAFSSSTLVFRGLQSVGKVAKRFAVSFFPF